MFNRKRPHSASKPVISFNVNEIVDEKRKPRELLLSTQGIETKKGKNTKWLADPANVQTVYQIGKSDTNEEKFCISVVRNYVFEVSSEQERKRIFDSLKKLQIGEVLESQPRAPSYPGGIVPLTLKDFDIQECLGRGTFGKVYRVRRKKDSMNFAMKVLPISERATREGKIMESLEHPFLVSLHYNFTTTSAEFSQAENPNQPSFSTTSEAKVQKQCFVMDFVSGGELGQYIKRVGKLPESQVRFYVSEIVLALGYLHQNNIVYRDLKPENILISSEGHIKLIDFGLAKYQNNSNEGNSVYEIQLPTQTFCGTPSYLAPEVLDGSIHGFAVDWWSLGVLTYELLTGNNLFLATTTSEMYRKLKEQDISSSFPDYISTKSISLLQALLTRNPKNRLGSGGVEQVKSHHFFDGVDWSSLLELKIKPAFVPSQSGTVPQCEKGIQTNLTGLHSEQFHQLQQTSLTQITVGEEKLPKQRLVGAISMLRNFSISRGLAIRSNAIDEGDNQSSVSSNNLIGAAGGGGSKVNVIDLFQSRQTYSGISTIEEEKEELIQPVLTTATTNANKKVKKGDSKQKLAKQNSNNFEEEK